MSVFRTCKNCVLERQPCDRRASLKAALSGLGVTSVKHRCPDRKPLFSAGQRVSVTWPVSCGDDEYRNHFTNETWPATVIKESGSRFLIKVDDALSDYDTPSTEYVKNPSLFAKPTAARLKALDEPARAICPTCGRVGSGPFGEGDCVGYTAANGGGFSHRPQRCAALAEAGAQS